MQGWQGNAQGYPADPDGADQRILFYWNTPQHSASNNEWTHLQAQGGRFSAGHFGPEITFSRSLLKAKYKPAIFKYSLGSASLAEHWKGPGEGGMYDQMVSELGKAVAQLSGQGHTVRFRALVWIQGESDAKPENQTESYGQRLSNIIRGFRENIAQDPNLPVILGVDEQHPWVGLNPAVLSQQKQISANDRFVVFTSMEGLEKADMTHLTPAGLQAHGRRIFDAYAGLAAGNQPGRR